jgi:hypothetical protein
MDYYMPRFSRLGSHDLPRSELVDKASDGPLHTEIHANYRLVDTLVIVSWPLFRPKPLLAFFADHFRRSSSSFFSVRALGPRVSSRETPSN